MENKRFEVKGTFNTGDTWHPYTKVILAPNEVQAKERTLAVIGSKHRLKRRYITINSVTALHGE
ncbi:MAG: 50S ribosomal protein L18a [Methanoregulaceae archaeon]|nr:50S ribosomal protein L18a [Methanoregulaceae archaeon]